MAEDFSVMADILSAAAEVLEIDLA